MRTWRGPAFLLLFRAMASALPRLFRKRLRERHEVLLADDDVGIALLVPVFFLPDDDAAVRVLVNGSCPLLLENDGGVICPIEVVIVGRRAERGAGRLFLFDLLFLGHVSFEGGAFGIDMRRQ